MGSESRQQRRARERAEAKAATRPGPHTLPERQMFIEEVELPPAFVEERAGSTDDDTP
jgi:hypothetical protein